MADPAKTNEGVPPTPGPSVPPVSPAPAEPAAPAAAEPVAPVEGVPPTPVPDDPPAPSSDASPKGEPETLLEAIGSSLQETEETEEDLFADILKPSSEASPPSTKDEAPKEGTPKGKEEPPAAAADAQDDIATELPDEPTAEELETYRPRTKKRIEQLLDERKTLRDEVKPMRKFGEYLKSQGISNQDMNLLLDVGTALKRGDYGRFLERITPFVQTAQQAVGLVLPPDIQAQVDAGTMQPDAARELSVRRVQVARSEHEVQNLQTSNQQQAVQTNANQVAQAVDEWAEATRKSDPDYGKIEDMVRRLVLAQVQEKGAPTDTKVALEYAKTAYDQAKAFVQKAQPAPRPTTPTPETVPQSSTPLAEPDSLMQVAVNALQESRG